MSADTGQLAARDKGYLRDAFERGGLAPALAEADPAALEDALRPGSEFKTPFGEDARREMHQRSGNDGFIQSNVVASRVSSMSEREQREKEKRGGSKDEMLRFYLTTMRGNLQELANRIAQDLEHWRTELVRIGGEMEELGYDFSSVTKAREHFEKTGGMELGPDGKPLDPRLEKFIEMWEQRHGKKFDPANSEHVGVMLLEADKFCKDEEIRLKGEQSHAQMKHDEAERDHAEVSRSQRALGEAKTPEEQVQVLRQLNDDQALKRLMAEYGVENEIAGLDFEDLGFDEMPDEDVYFDDAPDMKSAFDKASSGEASADIDAPKNETATEHERTNPTVVKFDF